MALEDIGIQPPNEEARKMIFNPSEEIQTVLMMRLAEMSEEELNALDEAISPKAMKVLMKFLPELGMLIEKIGDMKQGEEPEMQEQRQEMPPEETMGALKDIA